MQQQSRTFDSFLPQRLSFVHLEERQPSSSIVPSSYLNGDKFGAIVLLSFVHLGKAVRERKEREKSSE
jgi:hypothetical protein